MFPSTQALYAQLARTLGVDELTADADGGVQLTIGEDATVVLFAEDEDTLMVVAPVMELPQDIDYGSTLWLLRRNFYDSPLLPFRVSCDVAGQVVVWARLAVAGTTGDGLAGLIDALAAEANLIRDEIG